MQYFPFDTEEPRIEMDFEPSTHRLAIEGGEPIRRTPMPPRFAFGDSELRKVEEVFQYYQARQADPGYQGHFEALYCQAFSVYMGGGHADAVATGTAALYVALAAFDLPDGAEVLVSPITDPGTLSAVILNRLVPRLVDSRPDSYNCGPEEIFSRVTSATKAIVLVHAAGRAADIGLIVEEAHRRGILVLEDCSQAHGAEWKGRKVGTFGDIAAFSTMYRKAHITGASGGVVYSRDRDLFNRALAHADRGKPRWVENFDDRDPRGFLFPALNLHTDELSCAVGLSSLSRLPGTISQRLDFIKSLDRLRETSQICRPYGWTPGDSPFFYPILVDADRLKGSVVDFANAVAAEGIGLNSFYCYVVSEWPWVRRYLSDDFDTPNARAIRDRSFNLYVNEKYTPAETSDVLAAIAKVERAYAKA